MVYTRAGDYRGYENDDSGWELVLNKDVAVKRGVRSKLGVMYQEVTIPAGSTQAFYIWCKQGMLYTKATSEGAPFGSDGSLVINEGIGTKKWFEPGQTGNGQYSGWIRYYSSASLGN